MFYHTATEADGDFTALSVAVIFLFGSIDGATECVNVALLPDGLVESGEDFAITLSLNTPEQNVHLGNSFTRVQLEDSEGIPTFSGG